MGKRSLDNYNEEEEEEHDDQYSDEVMDYDTELQAQLTPEASDVKVVVNNPVKCWSLTLNNYTDLELKCIKSWEVSYRVIGYEKGSNGTPHLQCWICFKRGYRYTQLKKLIPRGHWEQGKIKDGENYCMKADNIGNDFEVTDNRPTSVKGRRNDLHDLHKLVQDGADMMTIINKHPSAFMRYHQGIEKMMMHLHPNRAHKPFVTYIYGPSGTGKSMWVKEQESQKILYWVNHNAKWWDGYGPQHKAVVFDDYRGDWMKFHELLKILDRYPVQLEVKGGYTKFNADRIYFTSDRHPRQLYNVDDEEYKQLHRRFDRIIFMGEVIDESVFKPKRQKMTHGELIDLTDDEAIAPSFNMAEKRSVFTDEIVAEHDSAIQPFVLGAIKALTDIREDEPRTTSSTARIHDSVVDLTEE